MDVSASVAFDADGAVDQEAVNNKGGAQVHGAVDDQVCAHVDFVPRAPRMGTDSSRLEMLASWRGRSARAGE